MVEPAFTMYKYGIYNLLCEIVMKKIMSQEQELNMLERCVDNHLPITHLLDEMGPKRKLRSLRHLFIVSKLNQRTIAHCISVLEPMPRRLMMLKRPYAIELLAEYRMLSYQIGDVPVVPDVEYFPDFEPVHYDLYPDL